MGNLCLKTGDDPKAVHSLLGEPDLINDVCWKYKGNKYRILVVFRDNKVIAISLGHPTKCPVNNFTNLDSEWFE